MKARKIYYLKSFPSSPDNKKDKKNGVKKESKGLPFIFKITILFIIVSVVYIGYEGYVYYEKHKKSSKNVNGIALNTAKKKTKKQKVKKKIENSKKRKNLYPVSESNETKINNINIAGVTEEEKKDNVKNKKKSGYVVQTNFLKKTVTDKIDIDKNDSMPLVKYVKKTECTVLNNQNDVIYYENKGGQIIPCWKDFNWNGKGITVLQGQSYYPKTVTDKYVLIDDKHNIWLPKSYFNCKTVKVKASDGN